VSELRSREGGEGTEESEPFGELIKAFGNLLHVRFEGHVFQGEMGLVEVDGFSLKAEVIEIAGDVAKLQVFEEVSGVQFGTKVRFTRRLLEAELGPGLLGSIFDGLQNPLEEVANASGFFLPRGLCLEALNRHKRWDYQPVAQLGSFLRRGELLGVTMEGRFRHKILLPLSWMGKYRVVWTAEEGSYPLDAPIARVEDEKGHEHEVSLSQRWPIKIPLKEGKKVKATKMMVTGERIIDTQFPIVKGGTVCIPGPFGAGKTVLQQHLAKYSSVDIVVFVACGERAGEIVEMLKTFPRLTDPYSGETLMSRTVIVCNTSSMPVAAREASVYMGTTIAEYYRQMGYDVLALVDSTSRWAQAMREMSGRLEEIPGEEAFPAYLGSSIAAFYERSGVLEMKDGSRGSLTIAGTVSPAGGNFEEPVTQATLRVVGTFWGLSRARSDARCYPAIDPLISWSKYIEDVGEDLFDHDPKWAKKVGEAFHLLRRGEEIKRRIEVIGEEGITMEDFVLYRKSELYEGGYLQQNAFDPQDTYCPLERQFTLFALMYQIFFGHFSFHQCDEARTFFLTLQNKVRNLNTLPLRGERYQQELEELLRCVEQAMKSEKIGA